MDQTTPYMLMLLTSPLFVLIYVLIYATIHILPFWFIFSKAGFSKFLSLLMIIPIFNLIMLYVLAFARWPNLKGRDQQ